MAEQHTGNSKQTTGADMMQMQGELVRARDIVGGTIYITDAATDEGWDPDHVYDTLGGEWTSIGEIEDLVVSNDGTITGIVAEVGGFLDVADKHVLISVDQLNLVAADEYAYVTNMSEEELEAQEGIDKGWWN